MDVPSPFGTALSMAAALKTDHEANIAAAGVDATVQDTQHGRIGLHTDAMTNDVELVKVRQITVPACFLINWLIQVMSCL
ncbi:putative non-specific serine/threonine protein kinase [Helianthus anomalus]